MNNLNMYAGATLIDDSTLDFSSRFKLPHGTVSLADIDAKLKERGSSLDELIEGMGIDK